MDDLALGSRVRAELALNDGTSHIEVEVVAKGHTVSFPHAGGRGGQADRHASPRSRNREPRRVGFARAVVSGSNPESRLNRDELHSCRHVGRGPRDGQVAHIGTGVDLPWTGDLLFGIAHQLVPMGQPPNGARNRE